MPSNFYNYLVEKNIISKEKLIEAQKKSKESLISLQEVLLQDYIEEEVFFRAKSEFFNIPLRHISKEEIAPGVIDEISEEIAKSYYIVPIARTKDRLEVGIVNPEDFTVNSVLNFIARQHHIKVKTFLITLSDFNSIFQQYGEIKGEVENVLSELEKESETTKEATKEIEEETIAEAPISKIVAVIIRHAVTGGASDIHIEPFGSKLRVRFRVDGILYPSLFLEKEILAPIVSRFKILANLRIDETRVPQDGRFFANILGRRIDFRVGTFPTSLGEKVAIRVLDPEKAIVSLEELGLNERNRKLIEQTSNLPFGLLIFSGPTGSGKTTTQYAILKGLNKENVNIVSLEDPVEYLIDGINQSQVKPEIGYDFSSGLREIVRQDPDIIMIGEIRDKETANLVTHAALTGHLVLSTLHTNNAIGTLVRLRDLGVEDYLIPSTLRLSVAQRLVRRLCPHCKEKIKANPLQEKIIKEEIESLPPSEKKKVNLPKDIYIYKPIGCSKCAGRGTKGRIGLFEVLKMTPQLEEMILNNFSPNEFIKEAKRQGMITLKQDAILKILDGLISFEEAMKEVEVSF